MTIELGGRFLPRSAVYASSKELEKVGHTFPADADLTPGQCEEGYANGR